MQFRQIPPGIFTLRVAKFNRPSYRLGVTDDQPIEVSDLSAITTADVPIPRCHHCGALADRWIWASGDVLAFRFGCCRGGRQLDLYCVPEYQAMPSFSNASEPPQRWGEPIDRGPTTACFDCGAIIPVGDAFYSSTRDERAVCEGCFQKAEKAGRAKCRT